MVDEKMIRERLECLKKSMYHELNQLKEKLNEGSPQSVNEKSNIKMEQISRADKLEKHHRAIKRSYRTSVHRTY